MIKQEHDIVFIDKVRNLFKKPKKVKKDDLGIYHEIFAIDTNAEGVHSIKYDVFLKIKVIETYDNLVEIDVIDIKILDSINTDVLSIIKATLPKYVNPKNVKWQIETK